jgi:hypothetical protein
MKKYAKQELAKYWPVSRELMAEYKDGTETRNAGGDLYWLQNGLWHRDGDKPAVIRANGTLAWFQNNQYHRDGDYPAWIGADGSLAWWQNYQLHRSCGPARIFQHGKLEWWINDKNITKQVRAWLARKKWQGTPEQITEFQLRFM